MFSFPENVILYTSLRALIGFISKSGKVSSGISVSLKTESAAHYDGIYVNWEHKHLIFDDLDGETPFNADESRHDRYSMGTDTIMKRDERYPSIT